MVRYIGPLTIVLLSCPVVSIAFVGYSFRCSLMTTYSAQFVFSGQKRRRNTTCYNKKPTASTNVNYGIHNPAAVAFVVIS